MAIFGLRQIAILAAMASLLAACGDEVSQVVPKGGLKGANSAPTIKGTPATVATASSGYSFVPSARDTDGDSLTFSISGKPSWASFNIATGELSGTAQSGSFAGIVIQVSDGTSSAALPAFTLDVRDSAGGAPLGTGGTGTATLSWSPPELNTDGSPFNRNDLAGYRVYHGTNPQNLIDVREVSNSGQTVYTLNQLSPGTHYFAVAVVTVSGIESALSAIGSKTIM
jgi:Putative Ig domain